jgi:hypothetical protein
MESGQSGLKPPPVLLAVVICDLIIRDELTKKLSLIGVFSAIHGLKLPVVLPSSMHLYAALTDGRGEYKSRIMIKHLESEALVFQAEGPLMFQDPQQVVELNFKLPQVTFPHWGRYEITLQADEQFLGSRTFTVCQTPMPPGSPPPSPSE